MTRRSARAAALLQAARLQARLALTAAVNRVPARAIETARRRAVARALLRHRDISDLGVIEVVGDPTIRMRAVDSQIVKLLYWYGQGGYEQYEVHWWKHFCAHSKCILEIGANVGYYTVTGAVAAPLASYTAVEPLPETADVLRDNVALNGLSRVRVVQAAVVGSAEVTDVELALPQFDRYLAPTGAFVRGATEGVEGRRLSVRAVRVPAVPMRDLLTAQTDLVKLDVEGSEHEVLAPVVQQLQERRATIVVEVLAETPLLRALLSTFHDAGYGFWLLAGARLREVHVTELATADFRGDYGCRDLAVIPREREDLTADRTAPALE